MLFLSTRSNYLSAAIIHFSSVRTTLTDAELQYFYFGLYRVLRRYRTTSITGWMIVFAGVLSLVFGWSLYRSSEAVGVAMVVLTIFAGFTVVWQNISALEEYLRVPFPTPSETDPNGVAFLNEVRILMKDIESGGWQEAYAGIRVLKELQVKYNLPEVDVSENKARRLAANNS